MTKDPTTASIIFAAGRGSRMKEYEGNKTLLPLVPDESPYRGTRPILVEIIKNLPPGPKALVVNYKKEEMIEATGSFDLTYCEQPQLNGTGGALLVCRKFLVEQDYDQLIITMGDVPLVKPATYHKLLIELKRYSMAVLGFQPEDKKKYGALEIEEDEVVRITEWKYWNKYPEDKQNQLNIMNAGIYAVRRDELLKYMDILELRPHKVSKERNGKMVEIEEFFIPDLIEFMHNDGLKTGYVVTENEHEVMGVDDLSALEKAQELFRRE